MHMPTYGDQSLAIHRNVLNMLYVNKHTTVFG